MGQDVPAVPSISINGEVLEVTDRFTYLGSTVTNNLSLDAEIDKRIAKAAAVMSKLSKRVWENHQLTLNTILRVRILKACVLSTLLYGSEPWTTYATQENRLEGFHLRCLRRIMCIRWQDRGANAAVLKKAGSLSMHLMLCLSTAVARIRASYGGRSHPKGPPVRSASLGMPPCRPPSSPLQGRLQVGPETDGHQPRQLGKARR